MEARLLLLLALFFTRLLFSPSRSLPNDCWMLVQADLVIRAPTLFGMFLVLVRALSILWKLF